ncbi:MAG: hypothetical protein WBA10_08990 [Elainellaceae cyanobacterium]
MHWLILLAIALTFILLGKALEPLDEVCALAAYSAAALSGLWGLAIAPLLAQIAMEASACGWLQVRYLQTRTVIKASIRCIDDLDYLSD